MQNTFYINGDFVTQDQAVLPVTDLALLRGFGIFDFMRTYNREPFHVEAHVARLFRSAELLALEMPWTQAEVIDIIRETLARNPHLDEANVRIVVTGGDAPDFLLPVGESRLIVLVTPVTIMDAAYYNDGAKIITVPEGRFLPGAKTTNYIPAIMAVRDARARGFLDAVYVNEEGYVLEGTTNNLFAVIDGEIVTSPIEQGILPGITRGTVIDLAQPEFSMIERPLHRDVLYQQADECFLTSSVKQVMPIVQVDEHTIGAGTPGPVTRRMMQLFAEHAGITQRA